MRGEKGEKEVVRGEKERWGEKGEVRERRER